MTAPDSPIIGLCFNAAPGAAAGGLCKWQRAPVLLYEAVRLRGVKPAQARDAFDRAMALWSEACAIDLQRATGWRQSHIHARSGAIDGAGKVLAWSYLPCAVADGTRLEQLFDAREAWDPEMLFCVAAHELGHAIGLDHGPDGSLMQPFYDRSVQDLHTWDVAQAVARYGPAVAFT